MLFLVLKSPQTRVKPFSFCTEMSGLSILNHKNNNIILMVIIIALSASNRASVYERLSIIKIPPMPFP
jgi:hypothetical protein